MTWQAGQTIRRREVLGYDPIATGTSTTSWRGRCWLEMPVSVVADTPAELVVYVPEGTPFTFPPGEWPTSDGRHPWHGRPAWEGHGCLMVHRPGDHHAVWHFWGGAQREFLCWYINIQTAFRRNGDAMETQDLELDIVVAPDGSWQMKDWDAMDQRVREGRFSIELVAWIRRLGVRLGRELDAGRRWWDDDWIRWTPDDLPGPVDVTACVGCGAPAASLHDVANGRVALCAPCAAGADVGCP